MDAWIGTSGWSYDHWHPELYPPGLPTRDRLTRYAEVFPTAELNSSFYRWPGPAAFTSWQRRLPDGFRLSVSDTALVKPGRRELAPGGQPVERLAGQGRAQRIPRAFPPGCPAR